MRWALAHSICGLLIVTLFVVFGAVGCQRSQVAASASTELSGQPSWFAIGPDVYQEGSIHDADREVLAVGRQPRWFAGFDRAVSKEEYEAYLTQRGATGKQASSGGGYYVPTAPAYPASIDDLPTEDRGVRLSLERAPGDQAGVVQFALRLQSRDRDVLREVEHRRTNVLPFLFAFYVDGRAVEVPVSGYSVMGGGNAMVTLVAKGGTRTWDLRVDGQGLRALLPGDGRPHVFCAVAAFSDRQHEGYVGGQGVQRLKHSASAMETDLQPLLVRSGPACIQWDGHVWLLVHEATERPKR